MANIKKLIEENGENVLGTWTIKFLPLEGKGGTFLGKLFVTDKTLYFDAQFDVSLKGALKDVLVAAVSAAGHPLIVSQEIMDQWENVGFIKIPKKDLKNIESKSSFFKKTITITLTDDSKHVFDYGMMGIKKLEEAIRS